MSAQLSTAQRFTESAPINPNVGVAIEVEGHIYDKESGLFVQEVMIFGQILSVSEWAMGAVYPACPELRATDSLSLEQLSGHLEFKTGICHNLEQAARQIVSIRNRVNAVLHSVGLEIRFNPVVPDQEGKGDKTVELLPASSDPESRSSQLVQRWGERTRHAITACLQVNSSEPFADLIGEGEEMELQRLERARQLYNNISADKEVLLQEHTGDRSFMGMTRLEHAQTLLVEANKDRFAEFGYDEDHILFPPFFEDVRSMLRWMCAFDQSSGISAEEFNSLSLMEIRQRINPKEVHCFLLKIKTSDDPTLPWVAETRWHDSVPFENATELRAHLGGAERHLAV